MDQKGLNFTHQTGVFDVGVVDLFTSLAADIDLTVLFQSYI